MSALKRGFRFFRCNASVAKTLTIYAFSKPIQLWLKTIKWCWSVTLEEKLRPAACLQKVHIRRVRWLGPSEQLQHVQPHTCMVNLAARTNLICSVDRLGVQSLTGTIINSCRTVHAWVSTIIGQLWINWKSTINTTLEFTWSNYNWIISFQVEGGTGEVSVLDSNRNDVCYTAS